MRQCKVPAVVLLVSGMFAAWALGPSGTVGAQPPAGDPVADLREALQAPVINPEDPVERARRTAGLTSRSQALRSIDELRLGLAFDTWKDEDRDLGAIDQPIREQLAVRLTKALRDALSQDDSARRLAAVTVIGEIGVNIREGGRSRNCFARRFAPDLVRLIQGKDRAVRAAAARALGKIQPPPKEAAAALGGLVQAGNAAEQRAAAAALTEMIRVAGLLARGRSPYGIEATREDVVDTAQAALPAAARGVGAKDPAMRRASLEVVQVAAEVLGEMLSFRPHPGDPQQRQRVQDQWKVARPMVQALATQTAVVSKALRDTDPAVCQSACQALEAVASVQLQLLQMASGIGWANDPQGVGKPFEDLLRPGLRNAVADLIPVLAHQQVRLRLAALYVLETLEGEAAPASEALVKVLQDSEPFVRWGAVRALARMAPRGRGQAVTGLPRLLDDENGDVRISAVDALRRHGPAAKGAVAALGKVVAKADEPEMRLGALAALVAIGTDSRPAVPAMVTALGAAEPNIRSAAARALGKLAGTDLTAKDGLLKALNDPDAEVRLAVGEALLNILPGR